MKLQDLFTLKITEQQDDTMLDNDAILDNEPHDEDIVDDEDNDDTDDEDIDDEDVGVVAKKQGFEKSKRKMYAFGKTRMTTLLTKDEMIKLINVTLQYVINPKTGAWILRACLAGQTEEDMVEFATGEDPSSLIKHLKKPTKITYHQAVEYLSPPANERSSDSADL